MRHRSTIHRLVALGAASLLLSAAAAVAQRGLDARYERVAADVDLSGLNSGDFRESVPVYPNKVKDVPGGGCRAAYFRCATPPWGFLGLPTTDPGTNERAMDDVFGAGNWDTFLYELGDTTALTSGTYQVIFFEGGDGCANEMESYLAQFNAQITTYVTAQGGGVFCNAAPNEGNGMLYPYGATLQYPNFSGASNASCTATGNANMCQVNLGYGIPGSNFTGNFYVHGVLLGTGGADVFQVDGVGQTILAGRPEGTGYIMWGSQTITFWHQPQPQAHFMRRNILQFIQDNVGLCAGPPPPTGGDCDLTPIEAKLDDETRFTDDQEALEIHVKLDALEAKADQINAKLDELLGQICDVVRLLHTPSGIREADCGGQHYDWNKDGTDVPD